MDFRNICPTAGTTLWESLSRVGVARRDRAQAEQEGSSCTEEWWCRGQQAGVWYPPFLATEQVTGVSSSQAPGTPGVLWVGDLDPV